MDIFNDSEFLKAVPLPRTCRPMRMLLALAAAVILTNGGLPAQDSGNGTPGKNLVAQREVEEKDSGVWSFYTSASAYVVPDDRNYVSPLFTADRDRLHLEGRYNYEGLDTASVWLGYNLSFGKKLVLDFTPMIGGVFGHSSGIAPGWRLGLSSRSFKFSTEAEFVFDAEDSANNFLYAWSELNWSPVDWFRLGLAVQRTRTYDTGLDFQSGFLVGSSYKKMDFTTYVFNWGWTRPTLVFSVGVSF